MNKKIKNAAHICNLIAMALRDNDFDENEKHAIINIANRLGITYSDFIKAISDNNLSLQIPDSLEERIQHLHDMVIIMMADGIIHPEEIKYIIHFTKIYGFEDVFNNKKDHNIDLNVSELKNQIQFQKFLDTFKLLTAEELSPIMIDADFNVSFPLYNSVIRDLGPLPKALYIFFLLQEKPVSIAELSDTNNIRLLKNIYSSMPDSCFDVKEKIDSLTNPNGESFNTNRSRIKKALLNALPNNDINLIKHYAITGNKGQKKSISLDKRLIQIVPKFI